MIIPKKYLVLMAVASIAMYIGTLVSRYYNYPAGWRLYGAISLHTITSVCCIVDVVRKNNPRKAFWIISFFLFCGIGTLTYLMQRKDEK